MSFSIKNFENFKLNLKLKTIFKSFNNFTNAKGATKNQSLFFSYKINTKTCKSISISIPMFILPHYLRNFRFVNTTITIPFFFISSIFRSRVYFGDYVRDRCREDINNSYYSIPQSQQAQQSSSHHHHHQQQSVATSTSDVEQLNGNNTNNNNNNSLVISPPSSLQLHQSSQQSLASSNTSSVTSSQQQQQTITPSVLYTVQRVVPTSQLPSNYGSNSNASSLSSIIARNETDCGLPNNNGKFLILSFFYIHSTSISSSRFCFHVIKYNYQCNYPCAIKNWQCPWQSFFMYIC